MKKIVILLLAVILVACSAPAAPTEQVAAVVEPSATPVVIVQTVIVEATLAPTDVPPPTAVPPTVAPPIVVTVVVEATQAQASAPPPTVVAGGPKPIDNALGNGLFDNMTYASDFFTLRCYPTEMTFTVHAINPAIKNVLFYYRTRDKEKLVNPFISETQNAGKMDSDDNGNFTITLRNDQVNPVTRWSDMKAWFEFQFVGLAKDGNVVSGARSEIIKELVTFAIECP